MSNRFNQFIKNAILINLGIFAISVIVIISYLDNNNLTFNNMFEGSVFEMTFYSDKYWDFDIIDPSSQHSSQYETIEILSDESFKIKDTILIESNMETIEFVHEDREDIRIIFEREVPDTSDYKVDYSATEYNDKIVVRSRLTARNIFIDKTYNGSITVYVPEDYVCENLTLETAISKIESHSIPDRVNDLFIKTDLGEIDMQIEQPLKDLSVQMNTGHISLQLEETIESLVVDTDGSAIELDIKASIEDMKVINNVGSIDINFESSPDNLKIICDIASVKVSFDEPIKVLDVESNMGDVNIDTSNDDEGLVYRTTELTDFKSSLDVIDDSSEANIFISMDIGSVDIK